MINFAIFYIEAMLACMALFGVLLVSDRVNIDRQEKQIKFDRVLITFIIYFVADIFWAAITGRLIPVTRAIVVIDDFALYVLLAGIVYFWLEYAMAVEQVPHRNRPINRFAVVFPFLLITIVLVLNYVMAPQMLITDSLETTTLWSLYLMITPAIYLGAVLIYTMRKAGNEKNPIQKRKHIFLGLFPLITLAVGTVQQLFLPYLPIYCFVNALLLVMFYIQSIRAQISIDPLTNLNNRGELRRYVSQKSNLLQEGRLTIVIMMDIDSFKAINDTYGHAEGDRALVIIADSLKRAIGSLGMPSFLCRYGGDEFILIVHPRSEEAAGQLVAKLCADIDRGIEAEDTPYPISFSAGFEELTGEQDSIQNCIQRADEKLYQNKKHKKLQGEQNS